MSIYQEIKQLVEKSSKIVITSHKSPDGDSIGSSVGLYLVLKGLGKDVVVCHPDPAPDYLHWVPNVGVIENWEENKLKVQQYLDNADLIFSLDYNEPSRLGEDMGGVLRVSKAKKVMIDHHLHPENYVDAMLSDTTSCSTCQLVYDVIEEANWNDFLSTDAGICLYLGIMTDSGSFRFPSVLSHTHEVVANLLKLNINHAVIHENINDTNTLDRLRLKGYACAEKLVVKEDLKIAYIWLTKDELKRFNHQKGDTEGLVNTALSILGMKVAVLFTEAEGYVKISFRSKGSDNPVNVLASTYFNGGGHANASGGRFDGKVEEAIDLFLEVAPQFFNVNN
jgi:phosphoesterase RecJ-like protein